MRGLVILLTLVAAVAAIPPGARIVGGSVTTINQYRDMAALLFSSGTTGHRQSCGGIIINNRAILTAAHCTIGDAAARWRSRIGSTNANSGGVVHYTNRIINHPQYNNRNMDNDIAIIHATVAFNLNNVARAGSIAGANYNVGDNQVVWAAGWGLTANPPGGRPSEQLRHVQVWTVNLGVCRQRYNQIGMAITDNMLCSGWLDVGGRDQCFGDSGGPLYHNGVVVGVCSFGPPNSCADGRFPGVNARVSRYAAWINANR